MKYNCWVAPCLSNSRDGSLLNKNRQLRQHQDKTRNHFLNLHTLCGIFILNGRFIFPWKQEELIMKCPEEILKSFLNPINNQVTQLKPS